MKLKPFLMIIFLLNLILPAFTQEMPAGILFVGVQNETSDIYLWQPIGETGEVKALTRTPEKEGNAQWWAHKNLIVASREVSENHYGIIAINDELKTLCTMQDPIGSLGWPVPSPWDDRILCVRALSNGFVQPGVISFPDGSFEPFEFEGLAGGQLAWLSPTKIQLSRVTEKGFVITHRELDSGHEEIMVSGGQNWQSFINPSVSRNLFVRRAGQIGSIFELYKDSSNTWEYRNLTNSRAYDWQASTSSDGKTIIFKSLRGGRFQTIIRDFETGAEKLIPITGFSEIYFPMILDEQIVAKLASVTP